MLPQETIAVQTVQTRHLQACCITQLHVTIYKYLQDLLVVAGLYSGRQKCLRLYAPSQQAALHKQPVVGMHVVV